MLTEAIDEGGMAGGAKNDAAAGADVLVEGGEAFKGGVVGIDFLRGGIKGFDVEIEAVDFGESGEAAEAGVDDFRADADTADDTNERRLGSKVHSRLFVKTLLSQEYGWGDAE